MDKKIPGFRTKPDKKMDRSDVIAELKEKYSEQGEDNGI